MGPLYTPDDFDTQEQCEEIPGYDEWFTELAIMDLLVNDDQWIDVWEDTRR